MCLQVCVEVWGSEPQFAYLPYLHCSLLLLVGGLPSVPGRGGMVCACVCVCVHVCEHTWICLITPLLVLCSFISIQSLYHFSFVSFSFKALVFS